jgi:hypothetical protein
MQRPIIQSEVDPKCALETLCELLPYGFGDAEFERVHHWGARGKLNRFKNYCQGPIEKNGLFRPGDNNHLLHPRLLYILQHCNQLPPGRKNFYPLTAEALTAHPPTKKSAK